MEKKVQGALHIAKWGRSVVLLTWVSCKWSHTLQSTALGVPWIPWLLRDPRVLHLLLCLVCLWVFIWKHSVVEDLHNSSVVWHCSFLSRLKASALSINQLFGVPQQVVPLC